MFIVVAAEIATVVFRDSSYNVIEEYLSRLESHLLLVQMLAHHQKRVQFQTTLLSIQTSDVDQALTKLADAWRAATDCCWVWMWMFNTASGHWEFLACDTEARTARLPPYVSHSAASGILARVWASKQPILRVNPLRWSERDENDREYQVVGRETLAEHGCVALDCIPCMVESAEPRIDWSNVRIGVCLHYSDEKRPVSHPISSVKSMGQLTGSVFHNLFDKQKRNVTEQLNRITADVLASGQYKPIQAMEMYCDRVIKLIKENVRVEYVSLFCREWNQNHIACIATTGLYRTGSRIADKDLSNQTYFKGENQTGGVFLTGIPVVQKIRGSSSPHTPKFSELPSEDSQEAFASAIYPITVQSSENAKTVCGVIRCVNAIPVSLPLSRLPKDFDPIQLQALETIGSHIGVALEILLAFKEREKNISTTKHDLIAPLQGIRDLVERIQLPSPKDASKPTLSKSLESHVLKLRTIAQDVSNVSTSVDTLLSEAEEALRKTERLSHFSESYPTHYSADYRDVLDFYARLRQCVNRASVKASLKRGWRKHIEECENALTLFVQEFMTTTFGYRQPLCAIPFHDVQNLRENSEKARRMVNFLDLRLAKPKEFKPEPTHLAGDIIARLCNSLEHWAYETHSVTIQFSLDQFKETIPLLFVDRDDIERAISNLLVNAIKYSHQNKTVRIEPRRTTDSYVVDFVNEGIEIFPEEIEHIFREGYRSPRAIPYASGDGHGLKITKAIMVEHGGDVVITSGRNPTVVSLKFPASLRSQPPIRKRMT